MKLRKCITACVVAAAVVVTSAVTAMAAGSIDKNGKVNGNQIPNGYKLEVTKEDTPVYPEIQKIYKILPQAIASVNKGEYKMKDFIADMNKEAAQNTDLTEAAKENLTQIAEKLEGTEFVTVFYSLKKEENLGVEIKKTEDGKYKVPLTVENLTKDLTGIKVLAYNTVKGEWEIIEIPADAIDVENHTVTFALEDISLFSIIADDPAAAK